MNTSRHSFTLVELLVTIAIIVILAGILVGGIGFATRRADEAKTIAQIEKLAAALEAYKSDRGFYPRAATEADVEFSTDTNGVLFMGKPFYSKNDKKSYIEITSDGSTTIEYNDAWDNALKYQCPGTHNAAAYDICSAGKDAVFGTEDDICNWKENN